MPYLLSDWPLLQPDTTTKLAAMGVRRGPTWVTTHPYSLGPGHSYSSSVRLPPTPEGQLATFSHGPNRQDRNQQFYASDIENNMLPTSYRSVTMQSTFQPFTPNPIIFGRLPISSDSWGPATTPRQGTRCSGFHSVPAGKTASISRRHLSNSSQSIQVGGTSAGSNYGMLHMSDQSDERQEPPHNVANLSAFRRCIEAAKQKNRRFGTVEQFENNLSVAVRQRCHIKALAAERDRLLKGAM